MSHSLLSDWGLDGNDPASARFVLYAREVRPVLEERAGALEAMYAPVLGRPEIAPALMAGITLLQMMEGVADREAVCRCRFDLRWRFALGITGPDWRIDPSSLCVFRARIAEHRQARVALEAALEAMRRVGYLKRHGAVRIDSTHVLARIARLSRLERVCETLRLALEFLANFPGGWEPWAGRYGGDGEKPAHGAGKAELERRMLQAGADAGAMLARAEELGGAVADAGPVALLRRVLAENFRFTAQGGIEQLEANPSDAIQSPHDPDARWSTKRAIGAEGWIGYKAQICETVPDQNRQKGEPTEALITAVLTQPALASDNGSLSAVVEAHRGCGGQPPPAVHADAGYINAPELARAQKEGFELCGPMPAPPHSGGERFGTDAFDVDLDARRALCPAGKASGHCSKITESGTGRTYFYFEWNRQDCACCPLRGRCLSQKKKQPRRSIQVGEFHSYAQERRALCKTPQYQARMRQRNAIEGTNSELKRGYDLGRCRYRGLQKTDIQMQFTAAACNIRRWAARLCWLARQSARSLP